MKVSIVAILYGLILVESRRTKNAHAGKRVVFEGLGLLGVPFGQGQNKDGPTKEGLEASPGVMRPKIMNELQKLNVSVKDFGNAVASDVDESLKCFNMNNYAQVMASNQKISEVATKIFQEGRVCLTVGGDHTVHAGSLHALLGKAGEYNVAVVYLDAHSDINLSSTTVTGNVHGMVNALHAKELENKWGNCTPWILPRRRISLKNIGFIGLRAVDPPEKEIIRDYKMAAYTMNHVVQLGVSEVLRQLMARIDPYGRKVIHLSIDTDVLDPSVAATTTTPVLGGLLLRELVYIVTELCRTGRVAAIDWVELNTLLGTHEQQQLTQEAAMTALLACFGGGPQ